MDILEQARDQLSLSAAQTPEWQYYVPDLDPDTDPSPNSNPEHSIEIDEQVLLVSAVHRITGKLAGVYYLPKEDALIVGGNFARDTPVIPPEGEDLVRIPRQLLYLASAAFERRYPEQAQQSDNT